MHTTILALLLAAVYQCAAVSLPYCLTPSAPCGSGCTVPGGLCLGGLCADARGVATPCRPYDNTCGSTYCDFGDFCTSDNQCVPDTCENQLQYRCKGAGAPPLLDVVCPPGGAFTKCYFSSGSAGTFSCYTAPLYKAYGCTVPGQPITLGAQAPGGQVPSPSPRPGPSPKPSPSPVPSLSIPTATQPPPPTATPRSATTQTTPSPAADTTTVTVPPVTTATPETSATPEETEEPEQPVYIPNNTAMPDNTTMPDSNSAFNTSDLNVSTPTTNTGSGGRRLTVVFSRTAGRP